MNYWTQSKKNIWVAAHRGWCAKYPENTMEAFRAAVELGVDQIELDVRVTRDGELVIIHDATVDRTTNGTGKVSDKLLAELKALDAGSHKGEAFKGAQIPTFREFMEYIKDHPTMTVDIELKEYPTAGREALAFEVCDRILAMVDEYGFTDRVVINSFSGRLNEYVNDKYGKKYRQHVFYPISHLGAVTRDPYAYAYCCCMFRTTYNEINIADKTDFDRMAAMGVEPWAGASVRDEAGVDMAIQNGAVLITCNNPDEILALLRKKGYHA
jgi:glycerophosphoryl diester phosphodiesterase